MHHSCTWAHNAKSSNDDDKREWREHWNGVVKLEVCWARNSLQGSQINDLVIGNRWIIRCCSSFFSFAIYSLFQCVKEWILPTTAPTRKESSNCKTKEKETSSSSFLKHWETTMEQRTLVFWHHCKMAL